MPTKRIYVFDGTWANRNSNKRPTILNAIVEILSVPGAQQQIRYFPGVGTRYGIIEKYIGGGLGHGIEKDILEAIDDLVTNYSPGDEVIIIGYSRGAYVARCVVGFLNRLCLPRCDREVVHALYDSYTSGNLLKRGVADRLVAKYKCRPIAIKSLICIDTVGALGIPRTGICGLFNLLLPNMKKREFMETDISSNVEKMFHALALHESRGPFRPTLMRVPENRRSCLKQVYFIGSHSDVGKPSVAGSLCDIVLASVLQQLHDLGVCFNDDNVKTWFPRAGHSRPLSERDNRDWVHDPIERSFSGLWILLGRHIRQPGQYSEDRRVTNETIHASVRLRGYGLEANHKAIAGYSIRAEPDQTYSWHRDDENSHTLDSKGSINFIEEPLGEYEAWLHGVNIS
ncbi:hypothetical protein F4804DRAFT_183560 [Jackrogersella minutella]|nr:hypothetical protein F4804DRAFT_183560 [Jackrogersella minutella]